jgi:aspartate kinase
MALVVQKYGGTSVGTPERIRAVARRVAHTRARGDDVVVVVSAMGHTTDELLALSQQVTECGTPGERHPRELDMLLTSGERISMALLAMAIRDQGAEALSFTGSQAAIITDETHTAARIVEVRAERVREEVSRGRVVIVAGFQGVSRAREITTLGRGGSDTTAVALAAALKADRCEIYTDVDGIFTADPRRVPDARVIPQISHAEMLEMASSGAQVMQPRAVDIGARFDVDIRVLLSFREPGGADDDTRGTLITRTPTRMEELVVTGIASSRGQAKLVLHGVPAGLRTTAEVVGALSDAGVSVDMIAEAGEGGAAQLQVTVPEAQLAAAGEAVAAAAGRLGASPRVETTAGLARIALVGTGMHGRPGVYARAFRALLEAGVEVHAVSTSSISITLLVPGDREEDALRTLHAAFALEVAAAAAAPAGAVPA